MICLYGYIFYNRWKKQLKNNDLYRHSDSIFLCQLFGEDSWKFKFLEEKSTEKETQISVNTIFLPFNALPPKDK